MEFPDLILDAARAIDTYEAIPGKDIRAWLRSILPLRSPAMKNDILTESSKVHIRAGHEKTGCGMDGAAEPTGTNSRRVFHAWCRHQEIKPHSNGIPGSYRT
jgi:hypothetical protein